MTTVKKQIFYLNMNKPVHFLLDEMASIKDDFALELLGPQQKGLWKAQLRLEAKIIPFDLNGNTQQPLYIGFYDQEEQKDTRYQFLDLSPYFKKPAQYSLNEPLVEIIPSIQEILVIGHRVSLLKP